MPFSLGLNPIFLLLCLLSAAGLAAWTYRRTIPELAPRMKWFLGGTRFAALALILFLLFEPVWQRFDRRESSPVMAVLLDDSQSAGRESASEGSINVAEMTRLVANGLPRNIEGAAVEFFRFSRSIEPVERSTATGDALAFDGDRTNLSGSLSALQRRYQDRRLAGVILVSDGIYNTGSNPLYIAEQFGAPIYTIVVGDTTEQRDVSIRRVTANEIAYSGRQTPVQVGIRSVGFAGERVTVSLSRSGNIVASEQVILAEGSAEFPVDLFFEPETPGIERLRVAVSRLDGEVTHENNQTNLVMRVLESRRQLLLVAGAPGPDVATLRQILTDDPDIELTTRIQRDGRSFYEGDMPSDLSVFDAILLADYPGAGSDPGALRHLAEAARAGRPLIYVAGLHTDLNLLSAHLGAYLPAAPRRDRGGTAEAQPRLTDGAALPGAAPPSEALRRLPPLTVLEGVWQETPGARVVARQQIRGVDIPDPIIALRTQGGYRSAAVLGAGTWRWKNLPADLQAHEQVWPTLLSDLVQWVATREDERRVRVRPIDDLFSGDDPVAFTGQVYDERFEPVDDASVTVTVEAPDGRQFPHLMQPAGHGRFTLDAGMLPEGQYAFTASAEHNGVPVGSDRGAFEVGALDLEHRETRADADLMRQIALRSGGTHIDPERLDDLPRIIASGTSLAPHVVEEARSLPLWHLSPLLFVAIGLLAMEWFFRKRSGLL
jgi:hypothetical protein